MSNLNQKASSSSQSPSGRRIQVKTSKVHGKGLFAVQPIAIDERILEYKGEIISWEEADERHPHDPNDPFHTFYFQLEDNSVIDGGVGGNSSRWINHACDPNTEAYEEDGRVFIYAIKEIKAGAEITYNYRLVLEEDYTPELEADYACRCGSKKCRGTMLGVKE